MEKRFIITKSEQSWKQFADDIFESCGVEIFNDGVWDEMGEIENKIKAMFPNVDLSDVMSLTVENVYADTDEEISEYENYLEELGKEGKGVYDDITDDIYSLWMPRTEIKKYFEILPDERDY